MSDFTEQEFDLAMARLENLEHWEHTNHIKANLSKTEVDVVHWNPYSDLNQLMPIAHKYDLLEGRIVEKDFNEFISSLRCDLWRIYQDRPDQ